MGLATTNHSHAEAGPGRHAANSTDAVERLVEASLGMLADHVMLARVEIESGLARALRGVALAAGGGVLLLLAWIAALAALYAVAVAYWPPAVCLGGIAALNLVIGVTLMERSRQQRTEPEGGKHGGH